VVRASRWKRTTPARGYASDGGAGIIASVGIAPDGYYTLPGVHPHSGPAPTPPVRPALGRTGPVRRYHDRGVDPCAKLPAAMSDMVTRLIW
jgi:hypothetical protein